MLTGSLNPARRGHAEELHERLDISAGTPVARSVLQPHGRLVEESVDDGMGDQSEPFAIVRRRGLPERFVLAENHLHRPIGVLAERGDRRSRFEAGEPGH